MLKKIGRLQIFALLLIAIILQISCSSPELTDNNISELDPPTGQTEAGGSVIEGSAQENDGLTPVEETEEKLAAPPVLPRVGLYNGRGSWETNVSAFYNFFEQYGYRCSYFNEVDAVEMDMGDQFDLICFPGGFAAEYKNFISEHDNIRSYVEEGGLFVGVCAGAYYACDTLRWQGTDHPYPLGLYDGKGVGPLSGLVAWGEKADITLTGEHPVNAGFNESMEMYYFDGPYFEPYERGTVEILARYDVNDEPAVIAGSHGNGSYLLLGTHPELGGYSHSSPEFNLEGGDGAQWPWLHSALLWLAER
ncbi:MAG: BPL-N domain-containing protein [Bacillota bacterium]|nr:BPL-N domain-containing protein [Bacillota bacterium]